ncbi:hypothetical protein WQ53_06245 [Pseudoxanthomonas suwonensis]|uniref:Transmembrane protein n=1 Tax=Pseudoxanthomonas suwonensis TaxID=314722 RepID=A0A0E3Z129_9GAMM|nr:hypothetical protein WQ53_06245 [Pseudoxanthomonas suwonensis]
MAQPEFLARWILATWLGWLLGLVLIMPLAIAGEWIGTGGAQGPVGVGMGIGVGLMQARAMRGLGGGADQWFWVTCIGLALPFVANDLAGVASVELPYSLLASVAAGGALAGGMQALVLRHRVRRTWWWVAGSTVGWSLAASGAKAADLLQRQTGLRGALGALAYLGVVAAGGLVLGLVTGAILRSLSRCPSLPQSPRRPDSAGCQAR